MKRSRLFSTAFSFTQSSHFPHHVSKQLSNTRTASIIRAPVVGICCQTHTTASIAFYSSAASNHSTPRQNHSPSSSPYQLKYNSLPPRLQNSKLFQNTHLRSKIESMIRVNQAGEQGAVVISRGQQLLMPQDPAVAEILSQEREHLRDFTLAARDRRVRPTVMAPFWHVAGYGLGLASAALGRRTAMVVHEAVEDVIADHYNEQLRTIHEISRELAQMELEEKADREGKGIEDAMYMQEFTRMQREFETDLRALITKCRDEEMHHKEIAVENESQRAPMYNVLYQAISTGCQAAIWISKRV